MIQFEHVTKHYEGEEAPVLDDFSMVIEDGEFVLLIHSGKQEQRHPWK